MREALLEGYRAAVTSATKRAKREPTNRIKKKEREEESNAG